MTDNIEKIINSYYNEPKIEYLIKFIMYDTQCNFIMSCWKLNNGFWFIANIYDTIIDENINDNSKNGWYLQEEPDIDNIPIRHSKICRYYSINTKNTKIMYGYCNTINSPKSSQLSQLYLFVANAYIEKIYLFDKLSRQYCKQEIMSSNISHSIRTPLNGILHITNQILKDKDMNNKYQEKIKYLNQAAVSLANNIFDIVDITKLELCKLTIERNVFSIKEMVLSVMSIADSLNKTKNVTLHFYIEDSVPTYIYSDKKRIKQILINLLENSLQYCNSGEITLYISSNVVNLYDEDFENSTSDINHELYSTDVQYDINFSVRDTGIGIDEATKIQLFYPMEIIRNSKQQGISLRVSYMLARLLGGDLRLIYSEQNKGTCMEFNIIVCEEPPIEIFNNIKFLKGKNILLFDRTNNNNISKILEKYLINYTISSSYEELQILHKEKSFDLIIIKAENNDAIIDLIEKIFPDTKILYIDNFTHDKDIKIQLLDIFKEPVIINHKKKRILVVEDEDINRIVINEILENMGHTVKLAINGEDAFKIFVNDFTSYDILLIDIRMPGISGFELADKINNFCSSRKIQVPKMIGVTAQLITDEDIKPWFNMFIYKPISMEELRLVLDK